MQPARTYCATQRTLDEHLTRTCKFGPNGEAVGDIVSAIATASKMIAHQVAMSGIEATYAVGGAANSTGDSQKKLDLLTNDVMHSALSGCGRVAIAVSEEDPEPVIFGPVTERAQYAVVFDPLDGSSNIECSVSTGTIFGIYKCEVKYESSFDVEDAYAAVLRPGREMVAAGYVLYSSATIMVVSIGGTSVDMFALDPRSGVYLKDQRSPLRIPEKPKRVLSANTGNQELWNLPTSEFVRWAARGKDRYSLRYIGSMVADVHRTLLYGGIFFYAADFFNRDGKLRMLYECFPMAYLMEAAGGSAVTGPCRMLDVFPTEIHQRSPIYLGCKRDVRVLQQLYAKVPQLYSMHCAPPSTRGVSSSPAGTMIRINSSNSVPRKNSSDVSTKEKPTNVERPRSTVAADEFWEVKLSAYTLTDDFCGEEDNFELSAKKGAQFQELVTMSDSSWTLATDSETGARGLLPTRLLICAEQRLSHKVAVSSWVASAHYHGPTNCVTDEHYTVDFKEGDVAVHYRGLADPRWCHVMNARTGLAGIAPTTIFA